MKKDSYNNKFREYARTLSPKAFERTLIKNLYESFIGLLGSNNCLQIGSYPRFTSITPIHDLDILYILGNWDNERHNPEEALNILKSKIINSYKNPTDYEIKISKQTHSVTITYIDGNVEIVSVDIVPAYILNQNEFYEDMYKVPEVLLRKHGEKRIEFYQTLENEHRNMNWINSDPRGYITIASKTDQITSGEFRKTIKTIKSWSNNLSEKDNSLKLKSFHLEQIVIQFFQNNQNLEIFDAIFKFFYELPEVINNPNNIRDRANGDRYIDNYLINLTSQQKEKIICARDNFLIKLENFLESNSIEDLYGIDFSKRASSEQFLFDFNIPTLIDVYQYQIDGWIHKEDGFRDGWLSEANYKIAKDRKIKFSIKKDVEKDYSMWKVQNDKKSEEVLSANCIRGEISRDHTKQDPENTKFSGRHFVECYAIKNKVCIAKSRIYINIG